MAGLLDLGGGVKMADPGNFIPSGPPNPIEQATQVLGLQNLVTKAQNAPLERRTLELGIEEKERQAELAPYLQQKTISEASEAKAKAAGAVSDTLTRIYGLAQTGDELGATQLFQALSGDPTAVIALPTDRNARNRGLVVVSAGDSMQVIDPTAEFRVKERIKAEFDVMKDLRTKSTSAKFDEDKWVRDTALKLTEDGTVATPREGILAARALNAASKTDASAVSLIGDGTPSKRLGDLSPEAFEEVARASVARKSAQAIDPLDISLVKKTAPSNELIGSFDKSLAFVSTLSDGVLPAFQSLSANGFMSKPGYIGGTINSLRSKVSAQPELVAALDVISRKTSFDKVLEIAATTFSDKVVNQIETLIPTKNDRIEVAYTKIATMLAITTAGITNKLDVSEAANVNVRNMRRLLANRLNTEAIAAGPSASGAEHIKTAMESTINMLGPDILKDQNLMSAFTRNLPGEYKRAAIEVLGQRGQVPTQTAQDVFAKDFGLQVR